MLFVEIGTQKHKIGRIELVNVGVGKNGICRYNGTYTSASKVKIKFDVEHKRNEGALRLLEKAFGVAKKAVDQYYSYPKEKVFDGLIRDSDIPKRYKKEFGRFLGICTCSLIERKPCPEGCVDVDTEKKPEMAINLSDLEGFLQNRKNGFVPMWD
jgi:hypothetical protein